MVDIQSLIAWIVGLFATNVVVIVGSILGWIWNGKKNKRELSALDSKNAKDRIDALKVLQEYGDDKALENLDLQQQLIVLNAKVTGLICQVACLSKQLSDAGIKPVTMEEALARGCK